MAYQNISIPRFYIDHLLWSLSLGIGDIPLSSTHTFYDVFRLNPSSIKPAPQYDIQDGTWKNILKVKNVNTPIVANYIAILGHEMATFNLDLNLVCRDTIGDTEQFSLAEIDTSELASIANPIFSNFDTEFDGFSIIEFGQQDLSPFDEFEFYNFSEFQGFPWTVGAISLGLYYDMPNSPNLSLTMSREYGSTKEITTHNGSSISNTMWDKPPAWGALGAWETDFAHDPDTLHSKKLSRSGRRVWDLKFSYMDASDLFGSNQMLTKAIYTKTGYDIEDTQGYELDEELDNGDFTDWTEGNPDGWTVDHADKIIEVVTDGNSGCRINNDDGAAGNAYVYQSVLTPGKPYKIVFDVVIVNSGTLKVLSYNSDGGATNVHQNGIDTAKTYTLYGIAAGTDIYFQRDSDDCDIVIDNCSVKQYEPSFFNYNLLTGDNFFSQVWHKTLGGTLPFIFQPDNTNNNPDQFAICKFKENSLKATQTAFNVYDISLTVEEVW